MNDDAGGRGGPLDRRSGGLAALAGAAIGAAIGVAVIGLAGCSGSRSAPQVASLGNGSAGASSAASGSPAPGAGSRATGNPTVLLDEWAACMRSHGDSGQADPTIDANKVIHIDISPSVRGGYEGYSGEYGSGGPGLYCRAYLTQAQKALGGDRPPPRYSTATLDKFAGCMRANGIPDFPDPSADGGFVLNLGGDQNPDNPVFQNATKVCSEKSGVQVLARPDTQPGTIMIGGGLGAGSG